jgi:hypothetical protein
MIYSFQLLESGSTLIQITYQPDKKIDGNKNR